MVWPACLGTAWRAAAAVRFPPVCGRATLETGLPLAVLPETCPYSFEQLLDDAYLGD
jgi:hypothetical protein